MYYLGFDIGGSSVKAVLVKDKKIIKSETEFLPGNLEKLLELLVKMEKKLIAGVKPEQIKGAGFALAGTLDRNREIMLKSYNISFLDNQPLKKILVEKLSSCPVKLEHDVHCFLLAEKIVGAAQNFKNVFYLTLGTGVGSAFMVNGRIAKGAHGAAGEAGHTIVDLSDEADLEEIASNEFIKKELGIGSIEAFKRAQAGEAKAREVFEQIGRNLGVGIANIINTFDPEAVILGGGLTEAKELIEPTLKEAIKEFVISPVARETKVIFSELGREGGALGAALLFLKNRI